MTNEQDYFSIIKAETEKQIRYTNAILVATIVFAVTLIAIPSYLLFIQ